MAIKPKMRTQHVADRDCPSQIEPEVQRRGPGKPKRKMPSLDQSAKTIAPRNLELSPACGRPGQPVGNVDDLTAFDWPLRKGNLVGSRRSDGADHEQRKADRRERSPKLWRSGARAHARHTPPLRDSTDGDSRCYMSD
jgi:hypothetical protein